MDHFLSFHFVVWPFRWMLSAVLPKPSKVLSVVLPWSTLEMLSVVYQDLYRRCSRLFYQDLCGGSRLSYLRSPIWPFCKVTDGVKIDTVLVFVLMFYGPCLCILVYASLFMCPCFLWSLFMCPCSSLSVLEEDMWWFRCVNGKHCLKSCWHHVKLIFCSDEERMIWFGV